MALIPLFFPSLSLNSVVFTVFNSGTQNCNTDGISSDINPAELFCFSEQFNLQITLHLMSIESGPGNYFM